MILQRVQQHGVTPSKRGCWTCKDRKVSCDRLIPACIRCSKSKRVCSGYGIRLSWPDQPDRKRALSESTTLPLKNDTRQQDVQWVNVGLTDIRLHLVATKSDGRARGRIRKENLAIPNLAEIPPAPPNLVAAGDMELLCYFETVVSNILPMLDSDRTRVRRLVVQIALSNRSQSSRAVLNSILALASYHRGDNIAFAAQMKHSALRALLDAIDPNMDGCAAIEHIAAGIILCVVEMQQQDRDSAWVGHMCGAKEVIQAVRHMNHNPGDDCSAILGWIYYFDVLARFSLRHWRTESIESTAMELGFHTNASQSCTMQYIIARNSFAREIPMLATHAHPILLLLTDVFETMLYASNPRYHTTEYQQSLDELRSKLEKVEFISPQNETSPEDFKRIELLRLASLVYLERVSRNFSGQSTQLELWAETARSILATLETYPCPFTLFIFGCEAHTDEDRLALLELFTRIESKPHLKTLFEVKGLIQSAWIQHDLEVDGTLEYIHKLNLVLSSRETVPSFM